MNEENNKKRNKIIIIVAVLFLLTAGIITVYSFKDTRAEEIDGETVDSSSLFVSPTVSCPTGFEMRKGASGCVMNANTLKKIPGLQKKVNVNWIDLGEVTFNNLFFDNFKGTLYEYPGIGNSPTTTIVSSSSIGNIGKIDCDSTECFRIDIISAMLDGSIITFGKDGEEYRITEKNYHIHSANPSAGFIFRGIIIYVFPIEWFDKYNNVSDIKILKDTVTYNESDSVEFLFDRPISHVTLNLNEENSTSSISRYVILDTNSNSDAQNSGNATWYFKVGTPTKTGYIFDGWTTEHDYTSIVGPDNDGYYTINFVRGVTTHGSTAITLKAVWEKDDSSNTRQYTLTYLDSDGETITSVTDDLNTIKVISGSDSYCTGNYVGGTFQYWKNTDTSDTDKYGNCSDCNGAITITSGRNATLKAVCSRNSGGGDTPSTDEYTLTLKKNCSGTFKCVSDTNSEVCNQLKNNGKFTKTIAKGDTFTFPKTFDTLTCDGNEINSWGSFELGQELVINSNITASAKWKSSSGGGDTPSTDEYTVTLKKNCSGTFKCVSDKNSEVCNQLKNNGKFTKNVTKGDTFIFPKTFDTLTCDGKNIDKWGIYNLGSSITVNSNITTSANWKDSSSNDDPIDDPSDDPSDAPSDDPIDNPQTGSIVIYLVLLFGIGALAYSVWYFRGFRKN